MLITRDMLIRKVAEESGYYIQSIRKVFNCLNKIIPEYLSDVTEDDEVVLQLFQGLKIGCYVVPERQRRNPKTHENIICGPTVKPTSKFSNEFKKIIQEQYDAKREYE